MWNALSFLTDYKIPFTTEGKNTSPGWVNICCPNNCNDDNYHGGFNLKEGYYHCWKCGPSSIVWIIRLLLHCTKQEAKKIFNEYQHKQILLNKLNKKNKKVLSLELPGSNLQKYHKKYLKKRNFDPDFLEKKYSLKGTGPIEKFKNKDYQLRIIIPIFDIDNKLVSFQGRDITDKSRIRYKGCPLEYALLNYKDILYNVNNCLEDKVIIVEGVFDCWRFGDNTVATFGTSFTHNQIKELTRFHKVFWLFDNESDAQKKAKEGAERLASFGINIELISLSLNKDPAELTDKEANYIKKQLGLKYG
ncbi:MAG: toprim domain-containing protein [Candidatus Hodarchaeota archaeon]